MCGLTGLWSFRQGDGEAEVAVVRAMAGRLAHRGPDDAGKWHDPSHGVVLAHRRLSIIDLSPAGHQPMVSSAGRWILVFKKRPKRNV